MTILNRVGATLVFASLLLAGCPDTERTVRPLERFAAVAPNEPPAVTAPFTPHVYGNSVMDDTIDQAPAHGEAQVDWSRAALLVEGKGYLPTRAMTPAQREIAAQRAARVVALRNAVRAAAQIAADGDLDVTDVRGVGAGRLRALVSGFTETAEPQKFTEADGRVGYKVKVSVPLAGVRGIGGTVFGAYHRWVRFERKGLARYELTVVSPAGTAKVKVIVIDARGLPLRPALWGEVVDPAGKVLLDYTTVGGGRPLTYARTDADAATLAAERIVVKATTVTGRKGGRIVLTETDATMLATTPAAAQALREAKVIVLTDAIRPPPLD